MTEPRCDLTDLIASQCGHCRGHDQPSVAGLTIVHRFAARFPGPCANCETGRIHEDDLIGKTEDGEYVCEACANRAEREAS